MAGIISFDVGGTTLRSGVVTNDGSVLGLESEPSPSYRAFPHLSSRELQAQVVATLVHRAEVLREQFPDLELTRAGVSIGAAVNAHTDTVAGRGPLWGPTGDDINLRAALTSADPSTSWNVVNDVTASLAHHAYVRQHEGLARIALLTISTGIALRTFDYRTDGVPVDRRSGLQGEIGHLPTVFSYRDVSYSLACDCGGRNHLNAFCSGRGIEAVLSAMDLYQTESDAAESDYVRSRALARALASAEPSAVALFASLVTPVAEALLAGLTVDPLIERVVVQGGVTELFPGYRGVLFDELSRIGLYGHPAAQENYFSELIEFAPPGVNAELLGAARCARSAPDEREGADRSWTVQANRGVRYGVTGTTGLLDPRNPVLATAGNSDAESGRRLVITDARVASLYGGAIAEYFASRGIHTRILEIRASEADKTLGTIDLVLDELDTWGAGRRELTVVAFGGGVVLDIVGLAASLYRRGIPYLRVPTSLLAIVDAAVGVKVGVNFGAAKNRAGAFHPPAASVYDPAMLATLSPRELRSGAAEILKLAVARDPGLFDMMEAQGPTLIESAFQTAGGAAIVERAITGMLDELRPNLWEDDLRRPVDLGHTFGPLLELDPRFDLLHGEAVSVDIAMSVALARNRGLLSPTTTGRVLRLLRSLELPTSIRDIRRVDFGLALDESARHRGGSARIPVPTSLGAVTFVDDITVAEIAEALRSLET